MWTVLRDHCTFRKLWAAATVDALGTWLLVMAVPVQIYAVTGSGTSTAVALAVQAVPALTIGPWAGVLVDHWPRRSIFLGANVLAALGVALIAAGPVSLIYAGLVIESVAACFLRPALQATVPAVVHDEYDRATANALLAISHSVLRIGAPLAGTALTASGWFAAVVVIDAASYLAAALLLLRLPQSAVDRHSQTRTPATGNAPTNNFIERTRSAVSVTERLELPQTALAQDEQTLNATQQRRQTRNTRRQAGNTCRQTRNNRRQARKLRQAGSGERELPPGVVGGRERQTRADVARIGAGVRHGWLTVARSRLLSGMLVGSFIFWVANAALTALLVPFVAQRLHGDGRVVGHLAAGLGAGYLLGSFVSRALVVRWTARTLLTVTYAAVGFCFLVLFATTNTAVAVVAITVAGVPGAVASVATNHHLQSAAPEDARGRVAAMFQTSDAAAAVAGALASPVAVALAGATAAPLVLSAVVLVAATLIAVLLRPAVRIPAA
ncbi:MFS transporter [Actinoplanes sp. Pm04-4]|uniref:MFS transporter n=1 Tax=Paractinoplanes pyxinae TaxID=2997416 RepID=A0ABT4BEX9_9ACTN|nr:MFS transporter [Actinoplanes pyxinae]MCY1145006.1 MFS transporter [Actinoplanes pyxinae]